MKCPKFSPKKLQAIFVRRLIGGHEEDRNFEAAALGAEQRLRAQAKAKQDWDVCEIGDYRLVWGAVHNARPFKIAKPREGVLSDAFAIGSTSARALCRRFGLDPDEMVEPVPCEACEERYESEREGSD